MKRQEPAASKQNFEEFYRSSYRLLLRDVIVAGGSPHEAEDALAAAMVEVIQRWDRISNPRAYARRAGISNLIKNRQRGLPRLRDRLIERGAVPAPQEPDLALTAWEDREWVTQLLSSLPPAQQEVLACVVDEFKPKEIAELLGKTEAAVRQNLCAARAKLTSWLAQGDHWEEAR
jgi:RNA polymerase sigma factor (sigma-70 family)